MITLQLTTNQVGGLWRIEKSPNNQQLVQAIDKIRNSARLLDRGGTLGGDTATQIVYKDYLDNPNLTDAQLIQIVQTGQASKITTTAENATAIRQKYPDYATSRNHQVAVDVMSILIGASASERDTISQQNSGLGLTGLDSTPSLLYRADPNGLFARNTASHDVSSTITDQLNISGVNKALWGFDSTILSAVALGGESLPIEEVWDSFTQIGGAFASSVSTLPSKLSAAIVNGVIDYDKAVAAIAENYRYYAQKTLAFSETAANQRSSAAAMIYREWADIFATKANGLMDSMLSSKQRLDNYVGGLNKTIDAMEKVGKYIGPVFDAVQMVVAIAKGDVNEVGLVSTGILAAEFAGSIAFWGATVGATAVVGVSAPVWAAVGVAALAAGTASYYGKDIYNFARPLFDKVGSWIPDSVWRAVDTVGSNISSVFGNWLMGIEGGDNYGGNYDPLGNFIGELQSSFDQAKTITSPIILDLDGNGVDTISKSAGVHFDLDGNKLLRLQVGLSKMMDCSY